MISHNAASIWQRAQQLSQELSGARQSVSDERAALRASKQALSDSEEALRIVQRLAQHTQQSAHEQIAGLVTRCLAAVFDEPYTFRIKFDNTRSGRTEAEFAFERDGHEVDPLTASGGGMVDVAAFALRLAAVMLSKPRVRRLLVLDEPFRFVSRKYQPALALLLQKLCAELKIQIIIVTHSPELVGECTKVEL